MELDYSVFNLNFSLRIFSLENESGCQAQTRSKTVTSKFKFTKHCLRQNLLFITLNLNLKNIIFAILLNYFNFEI